VRNFARLGALALVADPDPAGRALAAELAPGVEIVDSLERVLASDVRAVAIATPAATHAACVGAALEAGKDVFVEKPLALSFTDGAELVTLADSRGLMLTVGHVLEYHPAMEALRDLVADGTLGDLRYIYSNRLSLGKVRREENILWSFAPHDVAVILRLVGALPLSVSASGGAYLQPDIVDVTLTSMLFPGGVRAHIHVSWLHPFKEQRLVVIGSRKMATFDDVAKRLELHDQRVDFEDGVPITVKGPGQQIGYSDEEPLRLECEAFLDSVRTRRPTLTDGLSAVRVLRVLQAAQESLVREGAAVSIESAVRTGTA
jgi:predicted dehydrogenase